MLIIKIITIKNCIIVTGWTADDIAIMASQDKCRDLIQKYNAEHLQSPRDESAASEGASASAAGASSRQQVPQAGESFGTPALDEPGEINSRTTSYGCSRRHYYCTVETVPPNAHYLYLLTVFMRFHDILQHLLLTCISLLIYCD